MSKHFGYNKKTKSNFIRFVVDNKKYEIGAVDNGIQVYSDGLLVHDIAALEEIAAEHSDTASPTFTGTVTTPAIIVSSETASTLASFDATKNVKSLAVATYPSLTEVSYVKGLSSAVQTQINAKSPTAGPTFTGTVTVPATGLTYTSNGILVKAGDHSVTLTSSGATNVTLPTTGTLVTLAGDETLTTKTLTAPKFADGGFIADAAGEEILVFDSDTTPVNYFEITNSAAGTNLSLSAKGADTNISISYNTKGSGVHRFQEQSANGDTIAIKPAVGGGAAFTGTITSADLAADVTWTLPAVTGTIATLAGSEALSSKTYEGNTITTGTGTLTLGTGSSLVTSATNSITLTSTGATDVTLPTTGTLAITASPTFTGTVALPDTTKAGHTDGQVFVVNTFMCPTPGAAEWTPSALGATLPTDSAGKKCWVPLDFLKVGDEIVSFTVVGNSLEVAAVTLDCKLVSLTGADPITVTDVTGGGITQHIADGLIQAQKTLTAVETVATNKAYNFELLGTCGSGDSLSVIGIHVVVNRK